MDNEPVPFYVLADIVDRILEDCDEDVACTKMRLSALDPTTRKRLITSDLLNAWQVFYYFFEEQPFDDAYEILAFSAASALTEGIVIGEYRECTLTFLLANEQPVIIVSDDLEERGRFSGQSAYREAIRFIDSD